ncbi:MAG: hypothetical protein WAO71_15790 [Gallionella sp.]
MWEKKGGLPCGESALRVEISQRQNEERVMDAINIGCNFDEFLAEKAILDECNALAMKRVIAWQIEQGNESTAFDPNHHGERKREYAMLAHVFHKET